MNKRLGVELFLLFIFTIAVFILYFFIQPVLTYSACRLCDGNQYLQMYNYFAGNISSYEVGFPYYSRIFVPLLASLLPLNDAIQNFMLVNMIFSIASVSAIYFLWKKLDIPLYLNLIGLFWLLFHWTGLIRLNMLDPLTVDVPTYFIQTLFILIFINKKFKWLWLLAPVAVFQKESVNALIIILLVYSFFHNKMYEEKIPWMDILIALILSIGVKFFFTVFYPPMEATDKNAFSTVLINTFAIIQDPFKIIRWIVAAFTAFGGMLLLSLINVRRYIPGATMNFLSLMSLTYLALGIIAGGDMTRIIFLGFPFIMTWILIMLKEESLINIAVAFMLSISLIRISGVIPDPGKDFNIFASWYPEYSDMSVVAGWGLYMIFCFLVLYYLNKSLKIK
jgi:hypothetical protein